MKEKNEKTNQEIIDSYDYLANAATSMDCTGLIPSEPMSKSEVESYNDVYQYLPPQVENIEDPQSESES